jgi:hypothetical protein
VRDFPTLNEYRTFTVRRKATKRTNPWDELAAPPQEPFSTSTTDEAAAKLSSVSLAPSADHADHVKGATTRKYETQGRNRMAEDPMYKEDRILQ